MSQIPQSPVSAIANARGRKIVIVGGVAGGATAATRLRRLDETAEIVMLEKGEFISFANCGLPYHIGGTIKDRGSLLLQTPESIGAQYGLDVRSLNEVTAIDTEAKRVTVKDLRTDNVYEETYDSLIISTGAVPIVPRIPGLGEAKNVFTLRNIPDMDRIKAFIAAEGVTVATVVGGGFIGLEMMENLTDLGIAVRVIEMAPQVMTTLDFEMAQILHAQINLHGVELLPGDGLAAVHDGGRRLELASGRQVATDLIIMSIGVRPEVGLAKAAGIELGTTGGIRVNNQLRTSVPDVYAVGDAVEVADTVTGAPVLIPLAWPANRQARLVADVINGIDAEYPSTQGTGIAKVYELTAASTGRNEAALKAAGVEYLVAHAHPNSHAGYYPGAAPISLKLLFAPDGAILGAQGVGTELVDKRIDVIATALKLGAKAPELAALELGYAPPYSSAKDPVNMLGYIADNMLAGRVRTFQWHEVDDLLAAGAHFLDVREQDELATGKLAGAQHIPLNQLRGRITEVPSDQPVYVFCQVGLRGYNAARVLVQHGIDARNLDGGYKTYKFAHYAPRAIDLSASVTRERKVAAMVKDPAIVRSQAPAVAGPDVELDACGLQCPGPILKVKESIDKMADGQRLNVAASDFGFAADIAAWCANTGNTLVTSGIEGNKVTATIRKGSGSDDVVGEGDDVTSAPAPSSGMGKTADGTTIVLFSGDLDKALAAMIIASGAAAYGKPVTIFCTFWGLTALKKPGVKIAKSGLAKAFDTMLPGSANNMPISKMNFGGAGARMIKTVMKQKNVDSLPQMISQARDLGVKFIACTMSMDLMGVERDELFDFVEFGGVAAYIGDSEKANMQLFI